jgi:uncharacterized repeat protein (TIGR03803 family)
MKTKNQPMKTYIKNLFLLPALVAGLNLIPAGRVTAQTFTTLHSFTLGSDGATPYAGLILSGNTLYGTAQYGGTSGQGTVFAVHTDGTGFTNLYSFTGGGGAYPYAGLILSGNTLYGTAEYGGSSDCGTVFAVHTNGTGFTNLHSFTALNGNSGNGDGANPQAGLILSGTTLYGTAVTGGNWGRGTVFAVSTDGTGFTTLYSFSYGSDGAFPQAGLILSGNTLYGTAVTGGSSGAGTVFAVSTDGAGFTTLHSFNYSDGANPWAGLILSGNTLYGTANRGGNSDGGMVFAVHTDGTGFTNLYSFTTLNNSTNSDGAEPSAGLILSGNTLYGTAGYGGSSGDGTVFAVHTDGTGFTNLYSFTARSGPYPSTNSDGANPEAGLILSGNTLYGTAFQGGIGNNGTVFSLSLGSVSAPQLTIIRSGADVVLTWPTDAAGFALQSTTNLVSPAVWITNSPAPVVVNGQNIVTNPVSGIQKFFRLSQ